MTLPENFYRDFEARFRGERSEIKQRLGVYAPFLEALVARFPDATAIDLGCGRGEWLEVLREAGVRARGVDTDPLMLEACQAAGLEATTAEALETLRGLPDESLALVSAFHLVEHIPFEAVYDLARHALRVLRPGGLLLLETPNPENVVVGATTFHMDPTHRKPLPSPLLAFVASHAGFEAVKVVRVQEPEWIRESPSPIVLHVLRDVSPDYAVVARKGGDAEAALRFASVFGREFGVSLETLAHRNEEYLRVRFQMATDRANHGVFLAEKALAEIVTVRGTAGNAEAHADRLEQEVSALRNSLSWKVTAPLRAVAGLFMRKREDAKK